MACRRSAISACGGSTWRARRCARPPGPRQVKAAALSFSFWHLGRFSRDYRRLFGELPSATVARAHGGFAAAD
ncbi:helix-turn-helix domain-containing protein [Roseomonas eburnea]|uniref:Helix-turn-helix domain-containing protein n=1 Tax=Neoroseomonas eburnea TaxID=1346889 RepID=A0A9X9XE93_9PROT|nr:helix-turn-helix domain-containing protein [Neoroseomonas eburnea]